MTTESKHRNHRVSPLLPWLSSLSLALVTLAVGCEGDGCSAQAPLPTGGLPADQTIEGGAQIRVTSSGFAKIESLAGSLVDDALADGFCLPPTGAVGVDLCGTDVGACAPGCEVVPSNFSIDLSAPQPDVLHVRASLDAVAQVHADAGVLGSCTLEVRVRGVDVDVDVPLVLDPTTGVLELPPIAPEQIAVNLPQPGYGQCGIFDDIIGAIDGALLPLLEDVVAEQVADQLDAALNGFLPDPLGIEGAFDLDQLLGGLAPRSSGLELRMFPGGLVGLEGGGLTLGAIVGINADRDPATRTRDLDSEPARCAPLASTPALGEAPRALPETARGTFLLAAAGELGGKPDPAADIAVGLSESALDLAGHHLVAGGGLCLEIGSGLLPNVSLGTISLLVPSLGLLGDGDEPLLLVLRPSGPVDFDVGDFDVGDGGGDGAPALIVHLDQLELDFYALLFERYMRLFTVRLSTDVELGLEFTTTEAGAPALLPVLGGLDADSIAVEALNTEFLRESPDDIAAVVAPIVDLAAPFLAGALAPVELPNVAGFTLTDLRARKIVTDEDQFLVLLATLGESPATDPPAAITAAAAPTPTRADTVASLAEIRVPAPAEIRAALTGQPEGAMPELVIDVVDRDPAGRALEYTWNLDGGMWRPFTRARPLFIRDPALAIQGRHWIEVRARVAGDYRTLDLTPAVIPVVLDSAPPRIDAAGARIEAGLLRVPARDLVSPRDTLAFAYGAPGRDPATAWGGAIAVAEAERLARAGRLAVHVRDQQGNVAVAEVDLDRLSGTAAGGCSAGAGQGGLAVLLCAAALLWLSRRRRRVASAPRPESGARPGRGSGRGPESFGPTLLAILVGLAPQALHSGCGGNSGAPDDGTCELHEDCDAACDGDTVGFCLDGVCECLDELPYGRLGRQVDMARASDGTLWLSGYSDLYGDLIVASAAGPGPIADADWSFVAGVPDGPVAIERSEVRGGIRASGDDVGRYTSIVVQPGSGDLLVAYHDATSGVLGLASFDGEVWTSHIIDDGADGADSAIIGRYASMTLRGDNGRPGVAYQAELIDADGSVRSQVRFASAQSDQPRTRDDWYVYVVDERVLPAPADPEAEADPDPWPRGTGLFLTSARGRDQTPILAYYDREAGALMMTRFDREAGVFGTPQRLAGGDGDDVGLYPALAVGERDEVYLSYAGADAILRFLDTDTGEPMIVDDGYREVGTTADGRLRSELHRVGADSEIVLTPSGPVIVYQDASALELRMAYRPDAGAAFEHVWIAGGRGSAGYGFYNQAFYDGDQLTIATWAIDPVVDRAWVEVVRQRLLGQ
ncbi:hypothetical protein [Haliangium sp.]|uniref:hypothetical protein n=1 Tax=Haliangium sp. TaxID=2663208 RepID=UPI003D111D36